MNQNQSKDKKIGWIEISKKKYGGVVYNEQARIFLAKSFEVDLVGCEAKFFKKIRFFKLLESLFCLSKLKGEKNLWIRDFYSTLTLPWDKTQGKNIVIVHHDDFSGFPLLSRPFFKILQIFFYRNLKKADAIITVSEYWKNYFLKKGYKRVFKIYNAFNVENYNIKPEEVERFKIEKKLLGKPIVYLGNCQKAKGVVETYNALKDLDVYLVTTGQKDVEIPALYLNLGDIEYLELLKASSVVLTMSKFKEGWCRTAHEAMLCKTPVIGSGSGGMKELLEGGKQTICEDCKNLREKVEYLLNNPEERLKRGEDGFNFAQKFTLEIFQKNWLDVINKILT